MDLSTLNLAADAERGFALTLTNPVTREETDIVVTVVGADSRTYRQARAEAFRASAKAGDDAPGADDLNALIYARCVKGWEGVEENGKPVPFTPENAERLLNTYFWIVDQVAEAVEKRANFHKPPEKS